MGNAGREDKKQAFGTTEMTLFPTRKNRKRDFKGGEKEASDFFDLTKEMGNR